MQLGTISKLVYGQEYGKIKTSSGEDAHFHKNCLWDIPFNELTEGQEVEFEIQQSYKGFLAFHIRPYMKNVLLKKLNLDEVAGAKGQKKLSVR